LVRRLAFPPAWPRRGDLLPAVVRGGGGREIRVGDAAPETAGPPLEDLPAHGFAPEFLRDVEPQQRGVPPALLLDEQTERARLHREEAYPVPFLGAAESIVRDVPPLV